MEPNRFNRRKDDVDHAVRLAVLETVMPRVEDALSSLALKVDNITINMVTKTMVQGMNTATANTNKETKNKLTHMQYQIMAIAACMVLAAIPGASEAILPLLIKISTKLIP